MFAGIIQAIGRIERVEALEAGVRLTIDSGSLGLGDAAMLLSANA